MKDNKNSWRKKVRVHLAAAFGGRCAICGYDKAIEAFDYHHIEAESKDNELSALVRNGGAWAKVAKEARKCAMLCCRCHREVHAGVASLPPDYPRFDESYAQAIGLRCRKYDSCPACGKEKWSKRGFCSRKCAGSASARKFEVDRATLVDLVDRQPMTEIGKMFGVSGNAIKKRCKRLGIEIDSRRGYWQKNRRE